MYRPSADKEYVEFNLGEEIQEHGSVKEILKNGDTFVINYTDGSKCYAGNFPYTFFVE